LIEREPMSSSVKPIPDGYHVLTPYLIVHGADKAIEFYKKAFGAIELFRMGGPDGRIGHAELLIGDCHLMLADEHLERGARSPKTIGGSPVTILIYVENVDEVVKGAIAAGAELVRAVEDQFYGDRAGGIQDPFGHSWHVATHVEDVPPDEMQKRAAEMAAKMKKEGAASSG